MAERFLTIKAVAELIWVTPLTLRNWDKKKLLTACRNPANNYRLYRYSDVADFLARIQRSDPRENLHRIQKIPVRFEPEIPGDVERIGETGTP